MNRPTKRKRGRPTKSAVGPQDTYIKVPCTSELKRATEKASRIYGLGVAEYIRLAVAAQNEWAGENVKFIRASGVGPKYRGGLKPG